MKLEQKLYDAIRKRFIDVWGEEFTSLSDEEQYNLIYSKYIEIKSARGELIIGKPNKYRFVLKEIMEEKQITSQALADKTGFPKQTIDQYRTGRREPSFTKGMAIAEALDVDPRDLIREREKGKTEKIISDELYEQVQKILKDTD